MFWKPLLIVAPAGLMLGTLGGHWAKPVILQRVTDDPVQAMFHSARDGWAADYPATIEGPMDYNGGYSYAPKFADSATYGWAPPNYDDYANLPLPTLAQLDARQAALLADPEVQYRSWSPAADETAPEPPAEETAQDMAQSHEPAAAQVALAPEPRTDDGALPAIW